MKKVFIATKSRGFLYNLFRSKINNINFIYNSEVFYETNSRMKLFLSKILKSKLLDHFGLIKRVRVRDVNADILFSYNKFLKSNKKYVIYLENPLALVHYSTGRNKTFLGKVKLRRFLMDPNLKTIICLSKACYETLPLFYKIPGRISVEQVYPLVENNYLTSEKNIKLKCYKKDIQCLYISSNFNLKGGKDILTCFKQLERDGVNNIKLKVITQVKTLDDGLKKEIMQNRNIEISDFNYDNDQLKEIYNASCILLNPTRQDSFSLVVLEAMKSGNAIISSDLYAIPEMVQDGINGYLTSPKFRFFNYDNLPNEYVWNNREKTIYSDYIDDSMVDFLYEKLIYLNNNRGELERLTKNSYLKSNTGEFNNVYIKDKWEQIFYDAITDKTGGI
ncbi:glycosyltransferase family 4 protein [Siminovitchia fortis]|uniref:glycosyltransferase family 4 protein n=1 Tax=Siminovitchia fortis TaxID=254758 RepID=UPI0011A375D1|nr:glycosyltransferase family 4 protein [Siminovitchia fortis]